MSRLLLTMLLVSAAFPSSAAEGGGVFGQGRTHFSLVSGNGNAFNHNYLVVGASASYYALDGLGVGLSFENWSGADPAVTKYAPFVQYVFYQVPEVQPYVSGYYRHTSVSGLPNIDSAGIRAGIYYASGPNAYVSVGMVYESYLNCKDTIYNSCSSTYPDISLTVAF